MAQALMSGVLANTGETAAAPEYSKRAFALRDRVSERERFFISWRYYMDAVQDWDHALELAGLWAKTYPREAFAFNSLALASATLGQRAEAEAALREAIRLDPEFVPPYGNLIAALTGLGRFDEARALLRDVMARGIDGNSIRRHAYVTAFLLGDGAAMAQALEEARRSPSAMWVPTWEARTAAFEGRFDTAQALYARGVQTALAESLPELGAQWTMEDAELHAIAGRCDEARKEMAVGLALSRDNFTLERASRTAALCLDGDRMAALSKELSTRYADATVTMRVQLPMSAAALALGRGESARVLELLESVSRYELAPASELWPQFLRGQARLAQNDNQGAKREFQSLVNSRGVAPASPLFALAHLGLARAAVREGDMTSARAAYQAFFTIWKSAHPTLPAVIDARREYAALQ